MCLYWGKVGKEYMKICTISATFFESMLQNKKPLCLSYLTKGYIFYSGMIFNFVRICMCVSQGKQSTYTIYKMFLSPISQYRLLIVCIFLCVHLYTLTIPQKYMKASIYLFVFKLCLGHWTHSLKYVGDMTIVSCSVPHTELFLYLSFDFLHSICKETVLYSFRIYEPGGYFRRNY